MDVCVCACLMFFSATSESQMQRSFTSFEPPGVKKKERGRINEERREKKHAKKQETASCHQAPVSFFSDYKQARQADFQNYQKKKKEE